MLAIDEHRKALVERQGRDLGVPLLFLEGGGHAGHNGLRSLIAHIGADFRRVRIGIGHPGAKEMVHAWVLNDFAKAERPWVDALCEALADNADLLAKGDDASFQNKVHLAMQARGFSEKGDDGAA